MRTILWITGASSGIGAALAATRPDPDATTFDLSRSGGNDDTIHVAVDLSTEEGWRVAADHFVEQLSAGDVERAVLVHNAGTLDPMGFAGRVDHDAYVRNVVLNSAAPQVLGNAFLTALQAHPAGSAAIAILSSGAASKPYEGWSSYCAGKAAVDHWVRTVGAEQERAETPAKVVAVAPGVVATPMQAQIRQQDPADFPARDKFVGLHEREELVDPEDAARGIWSVLARDDIATGAVVDLRTLEPPADRAG